MKTELQKCLAGEDFNGGDKEIQQMQLQCKRLLRELNNCDYADEAARRAIMAQLFGSVGEHIHLDIDFHCEYGRHIHIGNQVIINMNCTFVDNNIIEIGDNVFIASDVKMYTATHSTKVSERIIDDWSRGEGICHTYALPIKICRGAWLGGGVIVLPGVTIGENSVIGAGSVVVKSIPANCVAVGNPARVIKTIDN